MFTVLNCIATEHDWRVVALAGLVCVLATLATFYLYARVHRFAGWKRWIWLIMTGVVAGSGIWTTHFLGMLAFQTGLPTVYDPAPTLGSMLMAIASVTLGFAVAARGGPRPALGATLAGGLMVGLGITFMHYMGMWGYRTAGVLQWNFGYVAASVLIGAISAAGALQVAGRQTRWTHQVVAAALLGLGILGMHFTGMTAVTVVPRLDVTMPPAMMSGPMLAVVAVGVTGLILLTSIGGVVLDTAMRDLNLRRLREALDVMPEGLAFYDAGDRLVAWNSRYEELCQGQGVKPYLGMSFQQQVQGFLVHGAYPDALGREEEWLAERKAVYRGLIDSLTQRTVGGRWLRITERKTADGGTVSVSVDITDLKMARDAAEESARRAAFAEQLAQLGHWRIDAADAAITWSPQTYEIYGLSPDTVLELDRLIDMAHPDDRKPVAELVRRHLAGAGAGAEAFEMRILRPDGQARILSGNSCAELDEQGRVIAVVGTLIDITEQKRLEGELRAAKQEADAAAAVKAEFLANMSHELRTPLTSIIGFTALAGAQADLPATARGYIERVEDASRALLCTVNDILDFSKLEAGQISFQPQPISLSKLGRASLELFLPQAAAKDLDLSFEMRGGDRVMADPDRLRQILLNLIGNAVKFTAAGGVVLSMDYDEGAQALKVEVKDTGPGISSDQVGALFKRFSQVDGSVTRAHGGTGLGLAICKGLVEAMDGEIGVSSVLGEGSRFWFLVRLPPASAAPATQAEFNPSGAQIAPGLRVLVVDDHPANRELARLFLEGVGADVSHAQDGEQAVAMASETPYDVILMDMRMPKLDGLEAMQQIRSKPGPNASTPILAFTAGADDSNTEQHLRQGFNAVVSKPLDAEALFTAMAQTTRVSCEAVAWGGSRG